MIGRETLRDDAEACGWENITKSDYPSWTEGFRRGDIELFVDYNKVGSVTVAWLRRVVAMTKDSLTGRELPAVRTLGYVNHKSRNKGITVRGWLREKVQS